MTGTTSPASRLPRTDPGPQHIVRGINLEHLSQVLAWLQPLELQHSGVHVENTRQLPPKFIGDIHDGVWGSAEHARAASLAAFHQTGSR